VEVPAGGEKEGSVEVVTHRLLGRSQASAVALHVQTVLKAGQRAGQALAEVALDDLDARVAVERSAQHETHRVGRGLVPERPRGADQ
jgi:hypothetical protein